MEEHLKDDGVALDGLNYRMGRKLAFDASIELFAGDPEAPRPQKTELRAS